MTGRWQAPPPAHGTTPGPPTQECGQFYSSSVAVARNSYSELVRCEEKTKLIEAYKTSVANYSIAVNDLNLTRGKISKVEYDRHLLNSETARTAAEEARLGLNRHTKTHDC